LTGLPLLAKVVNGFYHSWLAVPKLCSYQLIIFAKRIGEIVQESDIRINNLANVKSLL
jgi:hypothetical protein